jgi:6-phosphogluconolactonase (cycloisomerase 2 family)
MRRRQFSIGVLGLLGGLTTAAKLASAAEAGRTNTVFYAGVGAALYGYVVDAGKNALALKHGPYATPQQIQAAWQNPRTGHLYVASSDGNNGSRHFLTTFAVQRDGSLTQLGEALAVSARPIHITVDSTGEHLLVAYPRPSFVSVHRLAANGVIAEEIKQAAKLDTGNYPHEIRVFPSDKTVLVMARGVTPTAAVPEQVGSIRVFHFTNGQLTEAETLAPNGGKDFRPRNGEFSRSGNWFYAVLEAQNQLLSYALTGDRLSDTPRFSATTLSGAAKPGQMLSASRLHPSGRTLYIVNRATGTEQVGSETIVSSGEDSIAAFTLDARTGEPRLVQSIAIPASGVRGMGISAEGKWLVAAGMEAAKKRADGAIQSISEALCLLSIGADGRLTYCSRVETPSQNQPTVWAGAILH